MALGSKNVPTPVDVEPLLEAGLARRAGGDLAGGEALFREALAQAPDHPAALHILGLARFEAGDAEEAERLFERLTVVKPAHAEAHLLLANLRHWRDDRAGAVASYRRALELEPTHAAALTGLARALAELGDPSGAITAAERAVATAPDDASARLALASARRGAGELAGAAEAFAKAAALQPDLVAAHVGEAMARLDLDQPEAAATGAEHAVALDATLAEAWLVLGAARRSLNQPAAARAALERALALDPASAPAHLNLGLALIDLEQAEPAREALERALELDPTSAVAHANLSSLYILAGRPGLAKAHAQRALQINPKLTAAHQNLAALLAEEGAPDRARAHRDQAYAERNMVITTAAQPLRRVLILNTTESGNTPDRYLIPPGSYTRLLWFIEYATEGQMGELPAFDVAFNGIGDEDLAAPTAANAARFAELCPTRLLNPPAQVARTRRDRTGALLAGVEGAVVPTTVRVDAPDFAGVTLQAAAERAGLSPPFLWRPIGSHGGKGLRLIEPGAAPEPATAAQSGYLTAFHDFRSSDGLCRKYRAIFVDGEPLPYHLAVAGDWMVHYEHSGMEQHSDRLAEEARFLENPAKAIGAHAWRAVGDIGNSMGLDYAGLDFSLTADGSVLVFEANATMLAHPEAPGGLLAHKNPAVERIFAAFRAMLAKSG